MSLDQLPGFRRRFRVSPKPGAVTAQVEDDFHCMMVVLHHDGAVVTEVDATMQRAPWSTCPGAEKQVAETFSGVSLAECDARGEKRDNCTHLYDLVLLAANHAADPEPLQYDILVADPQQGVSQAEIRLNGETLLGWVAEGFVMVEPASAAGIRLDKLTCWIESLPPPQREPARLLRWAMMIAHGRQIPLSKQSDASKMPPNCYTFQPQRAVEAQRIGSIYDFSDGSRSPLDTHK
jgi:hypothetical protein